MEMKLQKSVLEMSLLLDYDRELDTLTDKTANYSMKFERYDELLER